MKHALLLFLGTAAFILWGCGASKPSAETSPTGTELAGAQKQVMVAVPKRKISKAARSDFSDVIKRYKTIRAAGLNDASCRELTALFADFYQQHPKLPESKFNEGVIWEECGNTQRAEQVYQALLRDHPHYGPALNNLGQINFNRGNVSAALTYFQRASEKKNSEAYANLAVIQRNRALHGGSISQVRGAIDNIHRSLAVDSYNVEAYATMALLLYDHAKTASQLEMARLICVQAIKKVDKNYAPIYNILGLILLRQRKVTPALAEFRKAAAKDDSYLEAHMNIGAVTLSFRDYDSAERAFSRVLSLNPDKKTRVEALVGLGVAYRGQGGQAKFAQAMQKYKEAQRLDPSNVDISFNIGILMQDYTFDANNPARGIADLQRARSFLQQYVSRGKKPEKVSDAKRRIKNINELIPMLREQQKMMQEVQGGKS